MANKPSDDIAAGDERPPLFRTWGGWYALVLGTLAALVALFAVLSRMYR